MYNKIRAKNIIRIKITMVTFTNYNQPVNINNRMLSLWTNSYSKFVIKMLKENH